MTDWSKPTLLWCLLVLLTTAHPHADLAARFRFLIIDLCAVVAAHIANDFTAGPLVGAIYMRLRRMSVRFDGIVARLSAGLLPPPRRATAGSSAPRVRAPDLLPHRRGWLVDLLRHEAAAYGGYDGRLGYLLRDPEMVALLAASPEIGRVLRPLWRMLSTERLPAVLRLQPRPSGPCSPGPCSPGPCVSGPCLSGPCLSGPWLSGATPVGAAVVPPAALPDLPDSACVEADASPPSGAVAATSV